MKTVLAFLLATLTIDLATAACPDLTGRYDKGAGTLVVSSTVKKNITIYTFKTEGNAGGNVYVADDVARKPSPTSTLRSNCNDDKLNIFVSGNDEGFEYLYEGKVSLDQNLNLVIETTGYTIYNGTKEEFNYTDVYNKL